MRKYYRRIFKSAGQDTFAFFVRKIVMAVSVFLLVGGHLAVLRNLV